MLQKYIQYVHHFAHKNRMTTQLKQMNQNYIIHLYNYVFFFKAKESQQRHKRALLEPQVPDSSPRRSNRKTKKKVVLPIFLCVFYIEFYLNVKLCPKIKNRIVHLEPVSAKDLLW